MTVSEMYRLLELQEGAGPAEVKKAYFRLIRKFPPEQNPEAFRQLREAYEALKDGPPKDQKNMPDWVTWKNPVVGYMLELADRCDEQGNYDKACGILGDALKIEPDNVLLHLLMARYQMYGEHPQNAAKYAEFVTRHLPDNREGWMLLANGYQNRGWYKKALPAFRKAYELGCRDPGFMLERIANIAQNGDREAAEELYREYAETTPFTEKTWQLPLEAFNRWAEFVSPEADRFAAFLQSYERFIGKAEKKIERVLLQNPFYTLLFGRDDVILSRDCRQQLYRMVGALAGRPAFPKDWAEDYIRDVYGLSIMREPGNLQPSWADLYRVIFPVSEDSANLRKFIETDALLCLVSNPEQTREEIPRIRENHPEIAEMYAEFLEAVEQNETDELQRTLKKEFERRSWEYTGSRYEELYGGRKTNREERRQNRRDFPEDFFDSPEEEIEEPFVRESEKVGRNDPCPCGSGRKFKKCCMGKGLYD